MINKTIKQEERVGIDCMEKSVLFSGRFCKMHTGHLITIARLGQKYDKVIVCILDYEGQFYPIEDRVKIMKDALEHVKGNYEVIVNKHHFGNITKDQMGDLPHFDVYGSGNWNCMMNMHILGFKSISVPRYPGYAASDDVKHQKLIKFLEDNGYFK